MQFQINATFKIKVTLKNRECGITVPKKLDIQNILCFDENGKGSSGKDGKETDMVTLRNGSALLAISSFETAMLFEIRLKEDSKKEPLSHGANNRLRHVESKMLVK